MSMSEDCVANDEARNKGYKFAFEVNGDTCYLKDAADISSSFRQVGEEFVAAVPDHFKMSLRRL
jgi:hypothetical protein